MNAIMAYFLNVLLVIIEVFALYQLGCTFFQKRYRGWRMLLLTAALAAVHVGVLLISGGNLLIKLPLFILVDMLWFRIVFRTHLLKCLVVSVLFSSIMMLGDTGLSFGMALLLGQLPQDYMQNPYAYYAFCIIVKIIELLVIELLKMWQQRRSSLLSVGWRQWVRVLIIPAAATVTSLTMLQVYSQAQDAAPNILLCTIILVAADMLSISLLNYIDRQDQVLRDYAILRRTMKLEQDSVNAWMNAYARERKQTHEHRNQLELIRGMVRQGADSGELVQYISGLLQADADGTVSVKTGRTVVDVIVNQKNEIAKAKGIRFYVNLDDLRSFALPDDALAVVLSNLLDNAIEASEQIEDPSGRVIRLNMHMKEGVSFLYIENKTAHPVKIVDNWVATTKHDAAQHGYGLKNIKTIMERYSADYILDYQDSTQTFCFSVQIPPIDE